jgi:vacuolar-type H+-ATPase subunit H
MNNTDLSPLEQIRQCEAEVTRLVAAAHESAGATLAKARSEAASLIRKAREAGQQDGQARYADILARAEEEAEILATQAKGRAAELLRQGEARMDSAVQQAVQIILTVTGEVENR